MLHRKKLQKYSLDDWEGEFNEIYGNVDAQRSLAEMWLLMMEDASQVAEAIRRQKYGAALRKLAHVFGWACSFVARCRGDDLKNTPFHIEKKLSEIIWFKYPNCCSLCGQERCICGVVRGELEELTPKAKKKRKDSFADALAVARNENLRPKSLDDLVGMFSRIYRGAHYSLAIEAIFLHFLEEVGEVSSCIREIRERDGKTRNRELTKNLEEELADIISWIASALCKLDYILGAYRQLEGGQENVAQTANLSLSTIVWNQFQDDTGRHLWCPKCRKRPCRCVPRPLYTPNRP